MEARAPTLSGGVTECLREGGAANGKLRRVSCLSDAAHRWMMTASFRMEAFMCSGASLYALTTATRVFCTCHKAAGSAEACLEGVPRRSLHLPSQSTRHSAFCTASARGPFSPPAAVASVVSTKLWPAKGAFVDTACRRRFASWSNGGGVSISTVAN